MPFKTTNNYSRAISREVYDKVPKAVFAAMAVSFFLNNQGIAEQDLDNAILNEWNILHMQGIVPQSLPAIKKQ